MAELAIFGTDLFGEVIKPKASGPVSERFTLPPFTILDARSGDWQERKRGWLSMGIKSEVGRLENSLGMSDAASLAEKDTSIFDPTLCELAVRWFSPDGGQVVDPFAGGSVRGIVAGCLGRKYWGIDLRPEQIAANQVQAEDIEPTVRPVWVCGDSI